MAMHFEGRGRAHNISQRREVCSDHNLCVSNTSNNMIYSGRDKNKSSQPMDTSEEFTDVEYLDEVLEENSADVQYLGLMQSGLMQSIDLNNCNIDGTMLVDPVEPQ